MKFDDLKKMPRDNGYIILDEIHQKLYKQDELQGKNPKEWLLFEETRALFKEVPEGSFADYMELLIEELMKQGGLETAKYDLVILNGKRGVITPDFLKNGEALVLGKNFLGVTLGEVAEDHNENTIENIDHKLKSLDIWPAKRIKMIHDISLQFGIDCITLQPDRHWRNWGVIAINGQIDRIAPHFDGGYAMRSESREKKIIAYNTRANEISNINSKRRFFEEEIIPKNWKNITLRYTQSKTGYGMRLFREAMEVNLELMLDIAQILTSLKPENAIQSVEQKIGTSINPNCSRWFKTVTEFNIREVGELISAKNIAINVERN